MEQDGTAVCRPRMRGSDDSDSTSLCQMRFNTSDRRVQCLVRRFTSHGEIFRDR